jgi:hypothetical protein
MKRLRPRDRVTRGGSACYPHYHWTSFSREASQAAFIFTKAQAHFRKEGLKVYANCKSHQDISRLLLMLSISLDTVRLSHLRYWPERAVACKAAGKMFQVWPLRNAAPITAMLTPLRKCPRLSGGRVGGNYQSGYCRVVIVSLDLVSHIYGIAAERGRSLSPIQTLSQRPRRADRDGAVPIDEKLPRADKIFPQSM